VAGRQWILVLAAGCADVAGIGNPSIAADAASVPCIVGGVDLCLFARPQTTLDVDVDMTIDKTTDCNLVIYEPPSPSVCVIYANEINIGATVTAFGSRALVLAATSSIEVSGTVDVSAYRDKNNRPAAADAQECAFTTAGSYGGGAGGSFAGKGGDGGSGVMGTGNQNMPAQAASSTALPSRVRGGCPGSYGRAHSGGGVWLAAGDTIRLTSTGRVLANGAGGSSTFDIGGGSQGGGSGGMVRLAAPHVVIAGLVAANGGGGAEGIDANSSDGSGGDGADGTIGSTRASGGSGASAKAGDGGAGGAGSSLDGLNGTNATGTEAATGGAGGGGAGFIHLVSEDIQNTGTTSPPPTL
jgi:hypothetical protein